MAEGYISNEFGKFLNGDTSSNDFNNFLSSGFYYVTSEISNSPWSSSGGFAAGNMIVIASANTIHQIIFQGIQTILMRRKNVSTGEWSGWFYVQLSVYQS